MTVSNIETQGMAELNAILQSLPVKIEKNILRGALRAGQKVVLEKARANINNRTGALSKSLRIKTSAKGGKVKATLVAGNKEAFYAVMVEKGTAAHFIKPKAAKSLFFAGIMGDVVSHPGAQPHPFMRPAIDSEQFRAVDAVREYVAARIEKEARK